MPKRTRLKKVQKIPTAKLLLITWEDNLGNTWSGVVIKGDNTIKRIKKSGGKIIKSEEV